ncbi:PH-domain-containing protein [Rhizodiscina lignyota]|uniref:PH-domain-containing protein n=1 Tax=Rhizodiscina lignyota TaxID=1504668 RepID=A0A9P4MBM6_9PEZI|nr:PH-domain-containing protein [Rhizodiscina lignyota]
MGLPATTERPPPAQGQASTENPKSDGRTALAQNMKIEMPPKTPPVRKCQLSLDMFSPVNQNGSFEFDRVIKSGQVLKRTRKTKHWKPIQLVLRPNLLSIYHDTAETKLRHQVILSDLTAVARQKDPKHKARYVFGLFSPSRNFHLSASSEKEAQEWVELIRREARIDEEDEEMILMSPSATKELGEPFGVIDRNAGVAGSSSEDREATATKTRPHRAATGPSNMHSARRPSHTVVNYSGNEQGSYSDFSDPGGLGSVTSLSKELTKVADENKVYGASPRPTNKRNASNTTGAGDSSPVEERIVYHGWLELLKSKGGVRQWRTVWCVLRPRQFAIYKNEEEYSATLIIPFSTLLDAVDIDPISKSKQNCFQLITEERTYRFCTMDEDSLARWLGAFKSLLAKRKEGSLRVGAGLAPAVTAPAAAASTETSKTDAKVLTK